MNEESTANDYYEKRWLEAAKDYVRLNDEAIRNQDQVDAAQLELNKTQEKIRQTRDVLSESVEGKILERVFLLRDPLVTVFVQRYGGSIIVHTRPVIG